ncbi:Endoribonuclease L-PSP, partial [Phlegmacium glaucopus]
NRTFVFTPDAVRPLPVFSQAVISKGHVYASGNIGCDKNFKIIDGGVQEQTRVLLRNLSVILKAAGSGLDRVVKANVYLTDMVNDFKPMNEAYAELNKMPARTCVGVACLPLGAAVEIECIAEV